MADSGFDVGVDLDLGGLQREGADAANILSKMTSAVSGLAKELDAAVTVAKRLGDNFTFAASAAKKSGAEVAALKKQMDDLQSKRVGAALAEDRILSGRSPNGGTLRDDRLRQFNFKAIETALNTADEQIAARFKEVITKNLQRLERTTDAAVTAALNESRFRNAQRQATFNDRSVVHSITVAADARRIQNVQRYGSYGSGADYIVDVQAKKADEARLNQSIKDTKYLASLQQQYVREQEKALRQSIRDVQNQERIRTNSSPLNQLRNSATQDPAYQAGLIAREQRRQQRVREAVNPTTAGRGSTFSERLGARFETATDYAAIGAGMYGVRSAVVAIGDLDEAMKKFQAITETSNSEIGQFRDGLLKMSESSRYAVKDLAEAATVLGQTGLSAKDVLKALPAITSLATAAGASLHDAVDAVTSVLGAYNMEASRSSDIANTMTAALNQTKLTMSQLQLGFSYSANVAKEAGVSFTELTAVLGGLAQAGIKSGSTLGTGTRQLIQDLSAPSEKLLSVLKPLGITLVDIDIKANGLIGVLENLRSKGFGSAEALRALDLRAAAAFTALGGQTDTMKRLQESLLLTDAASLGAAKASESLYAAFTRLGNSIVSTMDKAFGPALEALKGLVSVLSAVLSGLNKLGPAITVVGTALALLTTSFGTAALAGGIASFVGPTGWLGRMPVMAGAAGVALRGLGAAMTLISTNPLLLMGGLAVAGLFAAFVTGASAAEKRLDALAGRLNDLQSQQQQIQTVSDNAGKLIEDLTTRRDKLNADPLLRRVAIIEAQTAFKELGLSVSASANNIDVLIEALRSLRGELAKQVPDVLEKRLKATAEQIQLLTDRATASDGIAGPAERRRASRIGPGFRDKINPVLDFLDKPSNTIDTTDVRGQTAPLVRLLNEMGKEFEQNQAAKAMIEQLTKQLEDKAKTLSTIQGRKTVLDSLTSERNVAEIQNDPTYQAFDRTKTNAYQNLRENYNSIMGNAALSPSEQYNKLRDLLSVVHGTIAYSVDNLDNFEKTLEEKGFNQKDIEKAMSSLRDSLTSISKGVIGPIVNVADTARQIEKALKQQEKQTLNADLQKSTNRMANSNSVGEVNTIRDHVSQLIKQIADIDTEIIRLSSEDKTGQTLTPEEQLQIEQRKKQTQEELAKFAEQVRARIEAIVDASLAYDLKSAKTNESTIRAQIDNLKKELSSPGTTMERAKELRDKINELIKQATDIVNQQINIEAQREKLKNRGEVSPDLTTVTPGSVQAQIVDALRANQRSDLLATAMAFAQQESRFRPGILNEEGSGAQGLFQFMPKTWAANGGGDWRDVGQQIKNFIEYLGKIDAALKNTLGRAPTDAERYVAWQQGEGGAAKLFGNSNATAASLVGLDAVRMNLPESERGRAATLLASEFVEIIKRQFAAAEQQSSKYLQTHNQEVDRRSADARAANETKGRTESAGIDRELADKAFREQLVRDARENRADKQDISSKETALKGVKGADEAERLMLEIIGKMAAMMDREIAEFRNDPKFASLTKEQQKAGEQDIRDKYAERLDQKGQSYATAIGEKLIEEQKRVLDQLEHLQNLRAENPNKPIPGFKSDSDLQAAIDAAKKRLEVISPIEAKEREILAINREIEAAKAAGMASEEQLNELLARRKDAEAQVLLLKQKQAATNQVNASQGSLDQAIQSGTNAYYKSSGLLRADGSFKSMTERMSGYWEQAMRGMDSSMSQLLMDLFSGSKKAGDAFKAFGVSVLQTMLKIATDAATKQVMQILMAGGQSFIGSYFGSAGGLTPGAGGLYNLGGVITAAGGWNGFNENRDSVPIRARPGEAILRKSAVEMIGRKGIDQLNALGNRTITQGAPQMPAPVVQPPSHTNVWVVQPDQVPPPGPRDIVAAVVQDASNGGQIRKLIKTVVNGG